MADFSLIDYWKNYQEFEKRPLKNRGNREFNNQELKDILQLLKEGYLGTEIAEIFDVTPQAIYRIKKKYLNKEKVS